MRFLHRFASHNTPQNSLRALRDAPTDVHSITAVTADRLWTIEVSPGDGFADRSSTVVAVTVGGLLLAVALAVLVYAVVGHQEQLEAAVATRTAALQATNDQLERANALRTRFITTISHELRTPLTAVIGFAASLRRIGVDDPVVADEMLDRIERNGATLRRMIEEMLDFGRLERGEVQLRPTPTELGAEVARVVADIAPTFGRVAIRTVAPAPVWAEVDTQALERIIANLCSNVGRYAPGAEAVVRVTRVGDDAVVRCEDDGPGFADGADSLLERFVRGEGVMGDGIGIGLSLVHELVVAHGGAVTLSSSVSGGAAVTIHLPATEPPADPGAASREVLVTTGG